MDDQQSSGKRSLLDRFFPVRYLYLRSGEDVKAVALTPGRQMMIALGAISLATATSGQGLHPFLEIPSVYYSLIAIGVVSEAIILPQLVRVLAERRQLETEMRKAHDKTGQTR